MWIEIFLTCNKDNKSLSLPAWGVWIEIGFLYRDRWIITSLPAWGVWIEIVIYMSKISG